MTKSLDRSIDRDRSTTNPRQLHYRSSASVAGATRWWWQQEVKQ